ncbi:hypothetical protein [Micromonospora aurantiaca (nom. illeg.)]|uniref:hypothetical protein n=1 Tax=Micromonospora aurantiaca (nom. illeg.) TaxID=47850 RepID=UPI0033E1D1B2
MEQETAQFVGNVVRALLDSNYTDLTVITYRTDAAYRAAHPSVDWPASWHRQSLPGSRRKCPPSPSPTRPPLPDGRHDRRRSPLRRRAVTGRLHQARRRLDEMAADPFGGQVLRDLVPKGKRITVALAGDGIDTAVRRAVRDCGGTPAFLAVDEPGVDTLTLLIVEQTPGSVLLRRPGDWQPVPSSVEASASLGELIAALRLAHD